MQLRGQLQAAHARHVQVHQHQLRQGAAQRVLRQAGLQEGQGGGGVAGFAHHLQVRHGLEAQAQAVAHQRVVVDQEQSDGGARVGHAGREASEASEKGGGKGSQACRVVPWSVVWKLRLPDSAVMRSRMLRRPMPRRGSCCTSA